MRVLRFLVPTIARRDVPRHCFLSAVAASVAAAAIVAASHPASASCSAPRTDATGAWRYQTPVPGHTTTPFSNVTLRFECNDNQGCAIGETCTRRPSGFYVRACVNGAYDCIDKLGTYSSADGTFRFMNGQYQALYAKKLASGHLLVWWWTGRAWQGDYFVR